MEKNKIMNFNRTILILIFHLMASHGLSQIGDQNERIPNKDYKLIGYYGFSYTTAEFVDVDTAFFSNYYNDERIPTVNPGFAYNSSCLGFYNNRLHTSFHFANIFRDVNENDSLKSSLRQNSFTFYIGHVLMYKSWNWKKESKKKNTVTPKSLSVMVSPHVGIKLFKMRHVTSYSSKNLTWEQYIEWPGYDLRVKQISYPIGLDIIVNLDNAVSVGLFTSYLYNFSNHPIISTPNNRIKNAAPLPFSNFTFELGMGMGFNEMIQKVGKNEDAFDVKF